MPSGPPSAPGRAASRGASRACPSVSSEAQPPTSVAAANPARMNPNWMKTSWRKPPALVMSTLGKTCRRSRSCPATGPERIGQRAAGGREHEPEDARGRCPRRGPSAAARRTTARSGRARPGSPAGRPGVGMALDAPRSRRANASTPSARSDDRHERDRDQRRPVERARQRAGGPRSSRTRSGSRWREDRHERLVAVEQEPGEQHEPGDPGRGPPARGTARGRRPRCPNASAIRPTQSGIADAAVGRDRVARQRPEGGAGDPAASATMTITAVEDRRRARRASRAPDAAARTGRTRRTRGSPAGPRWPACPTGRGSTRGRDEGEERAVLPRHVAAERVDVDRRAAEALAGSAGSRWPGARCPPGDSGVEKTVPTPAPATSSSRPRIPATMMNVRRESRRVLAKMLPRP